MMSKIKAAFSKLIKKLIKSVQRFPETIVVVTLVVFIAILLNHESGQWLEDCLMSLTLGLPLFSAFKLFLERKPLALKWRVIGDVLITALLTGYYFIIPSGEDQLFMIRFITMMGIFYLMFLLIPYFYKRKNFSVYCLKLVANFFITYLYTLVLYLGVIAIIFTVDQLFALNIDETIYLDLFFVAVGIFGVTYFLSNMPQFEDTLTIESYPVVIKVLIIAILMPLVTAYTVVLYAYFAKILFG
ncbi:MAG: DUF4153 domain-containing protein, partial [Vallitaleaceae bacterium]|nr:DUF4153 domain-containing protein [Vallitaleaceae bacterium]